MGIFRKKIKNDIQGLSHKKKNEHLNIEEKKALWTERWDQGHYDPRWTMHSFPEYIQRLIDDKVIPQGSRLLDIGCGWGGFGKFAAENYGVSVVGVTVSKEQVKLGKELCKDLPVEFRLQDYRELNEQFDRIVSVGMIEHVGYKNYHEYFKVADRCLTKDGIFLLHTIGHDKSVKSTDAWTHKYIFPNGMHPSIQQLSKNIEGLFLIEDLQNIGADYDKTLMAWYNKFSSNWENIKNIYDQRFFRMWKYFLQSAAGSFRARHNQVWQIVLTKNGILGGYNSVR